MKPSGRYRLEYIGAPRYKRAMEYYGFVKTESDRKGVEVEFETIPVIHFLN